MRKPFEWWFGGIDLNEPADPASESGTSTGQDAASTSGGHVFGQQDNVAGRDAAGTSSGHVSGQQDNVSGGFGTGPNAHSGAQTGVTLSSEDSDTECEVQSTPEGFAPKTPFVGMVFESVDAALVHYNKYAKHIGFSVKIESSRKCAKDGEKDKSVFVCNKSGKNPEAEAAPLKQRNRTITILTDCKAKMHVKRTGARWVVTQFVEEHTHEVIEKFALKKYLRSHNKIPKEERKFIDLLHEVNLSSGRIIEIMGEIYGCKKNIPYNSKTVSNYTATLGDTQRIKDIPELLQYFEEIKKDDPRFFYKFKLDEELRVENIFWVDGNAREVYKLYNDCISFDMTFMTNMYNMPCAPFIGINRFGQSIQLGCGFVRNEKIQNFVCLFETFLEAMDGLHPLNTITDQDAAMRSAILVVFLSIIHRFCRWHIMQKVQEKLGPFVAKRENLRKEFNEVIDFSVTVKEFETKWADMIERHGVVDNAHFIDLYDLREFFVPAYFLTIALVQTDTLVPSLLICMPSSCKESRYFTF